MKEQLVIGYGTLLYEESLGDTIGNLTEQKKYRPVIVKGFKRLFNLLPLHYNPSFKFSKLPIEISAANLLPHQGSYFNGLAFKVSIDELSNLDKRENNYKRTEVPIYDFSSGKRIGMGMVYLAPDHHECVTKDKKYLPEWDDISYARTGAYRYGNEFGYMYDKTTFLADGKTLVVNYYKDYLKQLILDKI